MHHRIGVICAGIVLFSALEAGAWDADGKKATARKAEVDKQLKGLAGEQLEAKKFQIAKQNPAPKWVSKANWKDGSMAFSVGSASRIKNQGLLLRTSENRSRAGLNRVKVETKETKGANGAVSKSTQTVGSNVPSADDLGPLDWYFDEKTETLYTLTARKL